MADAYLDALRRELDAVRHSFDNGFPSTVFVGGGTPSCLSPGQLRLLASFLPFSPGVESTFEMNPDSASEEKLALLAESGVNRLSFGVQTFADFGLRLLRRRHTAAVAELAIGTAHSMGFRAVGMDLILGWPGQTPDLLREDLRRAAGLGIQHLSCYQLTLEKESEGHRELSALVSENNEELERELWDICEEFLDSRGFIHYETSNYARPGFFCRHNFNTWRGSEYVGLGLAAHSHLSGERTANTGVMEKYLRHSGYPEKIRIFSEILDPMAKARECAVFWFRLFEGIDVAAFAEKTGYDLFAVYADEFPGLLASGHLEKVRHDDGRVFVRVAKMHQPVLDAILVDLI